MTKFIIPCTEEQYKQIIIDAKKANKTLIKYVLDELLNDNIEAKEIKEDKVKRKYNKKELNIKEIEVDEHERD